MNKKHSAAEREKKNVHKSWREKCFWNLKNGIEYVRTLSSHYLIEMMKVQAEKKKTKNA